MVKDYSVQGTTKLQREKYAAGALALSILGAPEPSDIAKNSCANISTGSANYLLSANALLSITKPRLKMYESRHPQRSKACYNGGR